ncbi:MAG: hypothetical protein NWR72_06680 [Bacteroidia bacterium]|nr:hypothetical protein [Bacteroidia bacterium]
MKKILLSLMVMAALVPSYAQCNSSSADRNCAPSRTTTQTPPKYHRLMLVAGGGPQYIIDQAGAAFPSGQDGHTTLEQATNAQRLNWQAFGFLGYRFNGGYRAPHSVGVFGTYGQLTPQALTEVNALQGLVDVLPATGTTPDYREVEAGFMLRNWLRLSAGVGEQRFVTDAGTTVKQQYYSATTGFHLRMSQNLVAYANVTTRFGRDFAEFSFRPNAGLALQLRALRM